jgi:uncharacterized membrane protein YsdA (DUF1294 family)
MMSVAAAYLAVVAVMRLACFVAYGVDKHRAVTGGRRIPEHTLHAMAFLGGRPGALLGQRRFRHKTRKLSFRLVFWAVVLAHVGLVSAAAYAALTAGQA